MKIKLLILMLLVAGLALPACSCHTWTTFWGGDPEKECEDHWRFEKKQTAESVRMLPPSTVASAIKARPMYPVGWTKRVTKKKAEPVKTMPKRAVEPATAERNPCAAPSMTKTTRSYPVGDAAGNAVHLEKMAPTEIRAKEPFEYRIKVTNLTDRMLSNVVVTDCVPENLKIASSAPQVASREGGDVRWMLGELGPKASKMITVAAIAEGKGSITSCAEVSYDSPVCARINIVEPNLKLAKFAPSEVLTCDRIPLRYVVANTGTGFACDIEIKDKLQQGLKTAAGAEQLVFKLDSLAPDKSKEFEIMVDASKPGDYRSRAVMTSRASGTVQSNMTTTAVRQPVLTINESCPTTQYIGQMLTFDITVTNKGDGVASDTVIEATVPEHVKFDNATAGGRFSRSSPGKVVWNLGTLSPNDSRMISMKLRGDRSGRVNTSATAKAYCAETVSDSCQTMLSGIPAILLEVVDISDPVEVGQSTTYVISVTNQGSLAGTSIRLNCVVEDGMQYLSSSGPTRASVVGNTVSFAPLSSLAPKAQVQWRVNVKAVGSGDMRFKVMMNSDQLGRPVEETEATRFYK